MYFDLIIQLIPSMSFIALAAYLVGRSRYFIKCAEDPRKLQHCFTLSAVFSLLSIVGTNTGVPVGDAFANTRMIGSLMSGFMGGPIVGVITGTISGIHRYLIGGFTAWVCGLASVLGGLFAGIVRDRVGFHRLTWRTGAAIAVISEVVQKVMIIVLAKPFAAAWELERAIALPTTVVTVLGTIIFMVIIEQIRAEHALYGARGAELSLEIASQTLPFMRHGLSAQHAHMTAKIIYDLTQMDAVAITDREKVLAYIGCGDDHHKEGEPIMTTSTLQVIAEGKTVILNSAGERGCPNLNCPIKSGIVAPLVANGKIMGCIKLLKSEENGISAVDERIADGVANLLSVQLQLAEVDKQKAMRAKAEQRALQAQINPHFLFNTINIIMSFCRTDPNLARTLLSNLAALMQKNFASRADFVPLAEELEGIRAYLELVRYRFGARLEVKINTDPAVLATRVPVLSIQPLVENAVQHGLFPKVSHGLLTIEARQAGETVEIVVGDNGVGIDADKLQEIIAAHSEGIGLQNVNSRLTSIYGPAYGLLIDSQVGVGTKVTVHIPRKEVAAACSIG